ncbi:unnamed protein product, partial [Polarella glacialis]
MWTPTCVADQSTHSIKNHPRTSRTLAPYRNKNKNKNNKNKNNNKIQNKNKNKNNNPPPTRSPSNKNPEVIMIQSGYQGETERTTTTTRCDVLGQVVVAVV